MVPGTNVKVVAVRGLNSQNKMYLSKASNFYFGTDLLNDSEDFRIHYSQDNDEVRFLAKWKMGVQVAFPDLVVAFKL
jgi:spore coat polysaccharide biosynthesis protein SpsF (cytidylyltransferase family)